ncbi:hypothetical protein NQ318_015115 [Aromia moschata]|uniref:Glutamine amidotransferase type-2 domain-containing protein n=1 Tax=Aromia moschata TaxID=1265417 RepID=A0AAV8YXT0_9CUCU|nr:hypothetical protein NQ318_015115 [Aromia moschata]
MGLMEVILNELFFYFFLEYTVDSETIQWPPTKRFLFLGKTGVLTGGEFPPGLTHECGVFGAIGNKTWPNNSEIAQIICIGLEAYSTESTGIVTSEGHNDFHIHKGMGLVKHVFNNDSIGKLNGSLGIGHTRYSTSARSEQVNCQPFVVHSMHGSLAVAHNGELVNAATLRKQVLDRGVGLSTHSDSELITQALCLIPPEGEVNGPDWPARIRHLMQLAPLSYSLCIMLKDRIYAVRDTYGNRPLCLGRIVALNPAQINGHADGELELEEGWVVSSESCAFVTATRYVREVLPGGDPRDDEERGEDGGHSAPA